ncbi:hypothetical protein KFE25_007044 [Diacronema lutheri]|uniref:Transmembrane protein n=1 Tax=Diacronema lutheri TaxID=2081491 RepID=A0A8J6CAT6_DIALT|nr:hypothetical protein KFE25_007044 [Diacronema lutheri]
MALVAGIGAGLFVLFLFAAALVLVCIFASAHRLGPAIIGGATAAYAVLVIVLVFSPKRSETALDEDDVLTDARVANTIALMSILGLSGVCALVAVCTTQLAVPITAKPV